ncbi:nitrate- and nitrite sensing domain-containing protein [Streptomyces phyllanthi]|uniref:histidine kinase n=1 Tax=Streptomyces phyllanthi TaxID=1803180 RepID=A0A5N8W2V3_9ACTN|nr:nitrate- and nitrite sensing domain-containing protein [Streptomyces phyllanthi]MPY40634.1 PAS domain S-box protein [Streptomyces phyllanthi]
MLLVLLPVTGLLLYTLFGAVSHWREARTLRDFRTVTRVSFATTAVTDAVARERTAAVLARLRPGPDTLKERSAAQTATDRALERASHRADSWSGRADVTDRLDVTGRLTAMSRQLHAARVQTDTGSLGPQRVMETYGTIETALLRTVADLESGRPTRDAGRAADAHIALLGAIEAAERERAELAILLDTPAHRRPTAAGRWHALEEAQLDAFEHNTSEELADELYTALLRAPGRAVREVRDALAAPDGKAAWPSYDRWLAVSGARIEALRGIQDRAARELADTADQDLATAESGGTRNLIGSLAVLAAVTALALALRRSITRPLGEVSTGARALSDGDLSYDIRYAGRDELGDVADTFRDLRVTTERLAAEIRAMNSAIDAGRFGHRADVASFAGTWAQLLGGMNDTMASFAAAHGRRRKAEQELESIFNLSLDLLCICGFKGYFERVNPAFERTLGYPSQVLLSKPIVEFIHEDDRARVRAAFERLANGDPVEEFENRYIRNDGTECRLEWSAWPVPEEGLIYAAARDVTESRRAAREQAALRRVATAVAGGVPPSQVFAKVAEEVADLLGTAVAVLRYESDGYFTVLGISRETVDKDREAAGEDAWTQQAVRAGRSAAAPIVVDGRRWGAVVAASLLEPLPGDTESRLADFTELIATAIANADSRAQLTASRARVVAAGDASRRRIERDLHDGVQQRLVSLQLDLRLAESMVEDRSGELAGQLAHVGQGLDGAFQDLLRVARGIHPAILSRGGLGPALRALARRSAVPVELDLRLSAPRLPEHLEVAAYYVASECLTNAVKHARATVVTVEAEDRDDVLELTIRDDGVGGVEPGKGSGLIGLIDRVEAAGGRLTVTSPQGGGTTLTARIPVRERPADE